MITIKRPEYLLNIASGSLLMIHLFLLKYNHPPFHRVAQSHPHPLWTAAEVFGVCLQLVTAIHSNYVCGQKFTELQLLTTFVYLEL